MQLLNYEYGRRTFVAFDPGHFLVFTRLKQHIQQHCPDTDVEHVGSTAIPYIVGKRVVDLLVPCPPQGYSAILASLLQRGFQPSPFRRVGTDRFLLVAGAVFFGVFYNIHLQVCFKDSNTHGNLLLFRNRLVANESLSRRYEAVKLEAIASHRPLPVEYNLFKTRFIQDVLQGRER